MLIVKNNLFKKTSLKKINFCRIQQLNIYELKNLSIFLVIVSLIILNPLIVNSAEILQIKSSNTILVGDQNRNLTIELFCIDVNENDPNKAKAVVEDMCKKLLANLVIENFKIIETQ